MPACLPSLWSHANSLMPIASLAITAQFGRWMLYGGLDVRGREVDLLLRLLCRVMRRAPFWVAPEMGSY